MSNTQIADTQITVNVGDDGAWICLKASNGKQFCFQPMTQWPRDDAFHAHVASWCVDMQIKHSAVNGEADRG